MKITAVLILFLAACSSEAPSVVPPDAGPPDALPPTGELWLTIADLMQPPLKVGAGGCYQFAQAPATSATPCANLAAHFVTSDDSCDVTCAPTSSQEASVHLHCGACDGDYVLLLTVR